MHGSREKSTVHRGELPGLGKTGGVDLLVGRRRLVFVETAMGWKYSQSTGELVSPAGSRVGIGYSGRGVGLNNPAEQQVATIGPIPQGEWAIGSFFDDPHGKGPVVAHLTPMPGTETFGRDGFMVHGDNEVMNHTASEGCIILPRGLREMVMSSSDRTLTVTS